MFWRWLNDGHQNTHVPLYSRLESLQLDQRQHSQQVHDLDYEPLENLEEQKQYKAVSQVLRKEIRLIWLPPLPVTLRVVEGSTADSLGSSKQVFCSDSDWLCLTACDALPDGLVFTADESLLEERLCLTSKESSEPKWCSTADECLEGKWCLMADDSLDSKTWFFKFKSVSWCLSTKLEAASFSAVWWGWKTDLIFCIMFRRAMQRWW